MSKDTEIRRRFREQEVFWLLLVLLGGIMLFGLLAPRTWRLYRMRAKIAGLEERKRAVEMENHRLRLTLEALEKGRPEVWRLYVRNRLRFVEKGFVPVLQEQEEN